MSFEPEDQDPTNPLRGILIGAAISMVLWCPLILYLATRTK